jgi:hypothetical protein
LRFDRISEQKVRWEIDEGIANVSNALGEAGGLAPFFRVPGFGRTDYVEAQLAARGLVVFSTDAAADDWFRGITASQIVARAMARLEEKGRGMLLLHDIHPWTAAALPVLLKQLKDHGFHIVAVVPTAGAAAVASRSVLAVKWSMAEQTVMDDSGAGPEWPKLSDAPIEAVVDLPAPDEGAFDPHYALTHPEGAAVGKTDGEGPERGSATASSWPYQVEAALPQAGARLPVPSVEAIGWPVSVQPVVEPEPRPAVAAATPAATPSPAESSHPDRAQPPPRVERQHVRYYVHRYTRGRPGAGQHADAYWDYADTRSTAH